MVGLGNFFDRPVVESQPEYSVLPAGNYEAVLVDSRMKQSKAGKDYLSLEFKIRSGEFSNRSVWGRYMIYDTGAAGQIARNQLQALENATGVVKPADSSEWHDIPVTIAVKVVPSKGNYGPSNEITNFHRIGGGQVAQKAAISDDSPW